MAPAESSASRRVTSPLVKAMLGDGPTPNLGEMRRLSRTEGRTIRTERDKVFSAEADEVAKGLKGRSRVPMEETRHGGAPAWLTWVPTASSGIVEGVRGLMGQESEMLIVHKCPNCGKKNSLSHCLKCPSGGARIRGHDEMVDGLRRLLREAGFWVSDVKQPLTPGPQDHEGSDPEEGVTREEMVSTRTD